MKIRDIYKKIKHDKKIIRSPHYHFNYVFKYGTTKYLTDDEKEELDELREEKEIHIWDLDEEQLKKLRSEICVGSCYVSDYANSFEIDPNEVCNYSEGYLSFIEEVGREDTQEEFAEYCMGIEAA